MRNLFLLLIMFFMFSAIVVAADDSNSVSSANTTIDQNSEMETIALPPKDSTEYWVLRSEAVQEFIPFLTKKRLEMKTRLKMLADYLVKIGKADEFANERVPINYDPQVYIEILKIGPGLQQLNTKPSKERPSWDQLVEIAMQHTIFEGYLPTDVEETEKEQYIAACKKKEEYGQKVRGDLRNIMDQCARAWVYLDRIGELGNFKAQEADVVLQQTADKAAKKAAAMEQKQLAQLERAEDKRQQEFDEKMARSEFSSSRRERAYQSRQDQLLYRQTRLDERYVNGRVNYY